MLTALPWFIQLVWRTAGIGPQSSATLLQHIFIFLKLVLHVSSQSLIHSCEVSGLWKGTDFSGKTWTDVRLFIVITPSRQLQKYLYFIIGATQTLLGLSYIDGVCCFQHLKFQSEISKTLNFKTYLSCKDYSLQLSTGVIYSVILSKWLWTCIFL